jgi:putative transcriptional regulator
MFVLLAATRLGAAGRPALQPAPGRLLVASHNIVDPTFARTVILLIAYDESGAFGVVINRPTEVRLTTAVPQLKEARDRDDLVFFGGPVARNQMLALIRSTKPLKAALRVFDDVYASGSLDTLERALKRAPKRGGVRTYVGSAGWAPRQLDNEIARGDWYVAESDARVVFDADPAEMWTQLIQRVSGEWAGLHRGGRGLVAETQPIPDEMRVTAELAPFFSASFGVLRGERHSDYVPFSYCDRTNGRISTLPHSATGIVAAYAMASSIVSHSITV